MTNKAHHSLSLLLVLAIGLLWMPLPVLSQSEPTQEKAGHIVMASGRLIARAADGSERRLRRRTAVYAGDTIIVGKNAFIQIRFTDGSIFSLRPDTEFKVSEYQHQEQATENGKAVFELLKGGLRTISGSIGKKENKNYQLKTPISTIGIRGTHYGLRLCSGNCISPQRGKIEDGLYGGVVDGGINVKNRKGKWSIDNGRYFHVATRDSKLRLLQNPPGIIFDPAGGGQQKKKDGSADPKDDSAGSEAPVLSTPTKSETEIIIDPPVQPQPKGTLASTGSVVGITTTPKDKVDAIVTVQKGTSSGASFHESDIYLDASNNVVRVYHEDTGTCQPSCELNKGTATLTNDTMPAGGFTMLKADEKVYWGRWQGDWVMQEGAVTLPPQGDWHFMYSPNITKKAELDTLQTNKIMAHYSQWGAGDGTPPTDEYGNTGTYVHRPSVDVDFDKREFTNYQVEVAFSANTTSPARVLSGRQISPESFSGPGVHIPLTGTCAGCADSTVSGQSSIMLIGTDASHGINAFEIHTSDGANSAAATALLTSSEVGTAGNTGTGADTPTTP